MPGGSKTTFISYDRIVTHDGDYIMLKRLRASSTV